MRRLPDNTLLIRKICEQDVLRTYDPYDIWKTPLGFRIKDLFNHHRLAAVPFAASLTIFDSYINNRLRLFYSPQEYPIVRALAAQTLLKLYLRLRDDSLLTSARQHLEWLERNSCKGYHGPCWGLGFRYAVDKGLIYQVNTPLTTMTPYALEAFVIYGQLTGETTWLPTIRGVYQFLEQDIPVLEETDNYLVTAYSSIPDREVINAVSYVMYSYSLVYPYVDPGCRPSVARKIQKLYNYVRRTQGADGSWPYSPTPPSFIDCFHSCFVVKNVIKTARVVDLESSQTVASRGYQFVKEKMFVPKNGLFKRFARTNKPGIVCFDLYDNAEMLNLAHLMGDIELADTLAGSIAKAFVRGDRIYSHIDKFGIRLGPGFLRWAIMPYMYSLAVIADGSAK